MSFYQGYLLKMPTIHESVVRYQLKLGTDTIEMNELIGKHLKLIWRRKIRCISCGNFTRKSYNQGNCWTCFQTLASNDLCIMKPETCHYHLGTCREPEWGEKFCFYPHIIYLANSSGLKVGITRASNTPWRWMDQGATQALPFATTSTRLFSGQVEMAFKSQVNDRTFWQRMLKGNPEPIDLLAKLKELKALWPTGVEGEFISKPKILEFKYPVEKYPVKIASHNFDKHPLVEGILMGIKAQYLIFDTGVINIRKFQGYKVDLTVLETPVNKTFRLE